MDRPIPVNTQMTLSVQGDEKATGYVCTLLGYGRYGLQCSLPQILNKSYVIPTLTLVQCFYVGGTGNQLLGFNTSVMGYERTEPPTMVLASPTTIEAAERRASLRLPIDTAVAYLADGREVSGEQTRTLDLSMGGLRMLTGKVLEPGTALTMTLLVGDDTVLVTGAVMWAGFRGRRAVAGVQFAKLKEATSSALHKFLVAHERQQKAPSAR